MNTDKVREALQEQINESLPAGFQGYVVVHYVAEVGMTRMLADGSYDHQTLVICPVEQPDYITTALVDKGRESLIDAAWAHDCDVDES